jgi:hypothetical protein
LITVEIDPRFAPALLDFLITSADFEDATSPNPPIERRLLVTLNNGGHTFSWDDDDELRRFVADWIRDLGEMLLGQQDKDDKIAKELAGLILIADQIGLSDVPAASPRLLPYISLFARGAWRAGDLLDASDD